MRSATTHPEDPWGSAAWGGVHPGTLPPTLRAASAAAAVYGLLAVVVGAGHLPVRLRRRVLTAASALMAVGTLLNLASPSLVEKALWTPVAAALAVTFWLARPVTRDEEAGGRAPPTSSRT